MDMLLGCKEELESNGEERRREMKRGRKLRRSSWLKVATLNVGIMTRKGREMVDLMEQRGVDECPHRMFCVRRKLAKRERKQDA